MSVEIDKSISWYDLCREIIAREYRFSKNENEGVRSCEESSQASLIIRLLVWEGKQKAQAKGFKPEYDQEAWFYLTEIAGMAADLSWPFIDRNTLLSNTWRTDFERDEVYKALTLTYKIHTGSLIEHAKKGEELCVDKDGFEVAVGKYIKSEVRHPDVDRLILTALMDMEISSYLKEVFDERAFIGSGLGAVYAARIHPFKRFLKTLLLRVVLTVLASVGAFVFSAYVYPLRFEVPFFVAVGCIALFFGTTLISAVRLPFQIQQYNTAVKHLEMGVVQLPETMMSFYHEYHTSAPLSVRRLRKRTEELSEKGVVWPQSLWPLLDDLELRKVAVL